MTPIYHITSIENLPGIARAQGLWCDAERVRQGFKCVGIAHEHLKLRRARTPVRSRSGRPVGGGGTLADYAPFYFANRPPMLYPIHLGKVAGYDKGQADVVHLVCSVEAVAAGDRAWCFTDGHAVEAMTEFHDDLDRLDTIDWAVVHDRYWAKTEDDIDRKRRKQAEFLVHGSAPWAWFHRIGVIDPERSRRVREIIAEAAHQPEVVVERGWYY